MTENFQKERGIRRRNLLKSAATVGAIGAFAGVTSARGGPPGENGLGPCHKEYECGDESTYVKFEFICEDDRCYFVEETDTGLITIEDWNGKGGDVSEPIEVFWTVEDGYTISSVMAFGGDDCETALDPEGSYDADKGEGGLFNGGGNTAAISNLQFCLEAPFPTCSFYGTSREDPTAIVAIRFDLDTDTIVENGVGDIPDDFSNSNYPNGVAFDDTNKVWYFAEEDGTLKTLNEDDSLGINNYGVITPNGEPIAGASFWDSNGEYLFIPNGGDTLMAADISGGSVSTREIAALNWSDIGLGDLALDRDNEILYVSTTRSNAGTPENGAIFFSIDLSDTSGQTMIADRNDGDRTEVAIRSQIAFDDDGTLWAHHAGTGDWRTVEDLTTGELSDVVATTREYTDIARCGNSDYDGN